VSTKSREKNIFQGNERETFIETEGQKHTSDSIPARPNAITPPQKHGDCVLNQTEEWSLGRSSSGARERDGDRETERERDRERQRMTESDRETETESDRETETDRQRETASKKIEEQISNKLPGGESCRRRVNKLIQ